ncbi:hypothetical protein TIFTF001_007721 [Ficus carica]|uniref:Uncharacterized protein n=1 Tax=Ficus carica TaxID=3494 RepID=A0AA88D288_FICCA|nr:hypothetical protein TIFTF001_007721 [Ficus carica]
MKAPVGQRRWRRFHGDRAPCSVPKEILTELVKASSSHVDDDRHGQVCKVSIAKDCKANPHLHKQNPSTRFGDETTGSVWQRDICSWSGDGMTCDFWRRDDYAQF